VFESLIDTYFVTTRQSEFREYLPYVLVIGSILVWFIRGIVMEVLTDFRRVKRRRWLCFVVQGRVRRASYTRHYIGEIGPCLGSRFRPRWDRWLESLDESSPLWFLIPDPVLRSETDRPQTGGPPRGPARLQIAETSFR
jgi:hypothetical protein